MLYLLAPSLSEREQAWSPLDDRVDQLEARGQECVASIRREVVAILSRR
jgi:hypothetical protein